MRVILVMAPPRKPRWDANAIASQFLLQALRQTQERINRYVTEGEEGLYLDKIDWTCNLGCLFAKLSGAQAQWLTDRLKREQHWKEHHRQQHRSRPIQTERIVLYEGTEAGFWLYEQGRSQIDFEVDPALVTAFLRIDEPTRLRAAARRLRDDETLGVQANPSLINRWTIYQVNKIGKQVCNTGQCIEKAKE